ncbi:MAG: metallophosphoesterase [Clostridia bacterium]|nr:metallophosphoesterase [Clostridia bacterium]
MDSRVFVSDFNKEEYLNIKHTLRFNKEGKFRILFLGDPHGGVETHPQVFPAIETVVKATNPDLVLFPGDISGCNIGVSTEEELVTYLNELVAYLEANKIPWAHVYGNHDDNLGVALEKQQAIYESYAYCVSKSGPEYLDGVGNYVLPILASNSDEPVFNVWGLDSHNDNTNFKKDYGLGDEVVIRLRNPIGDGGGNDNARFNQIEWYMNTSKSIENTYGRKIPAILYQHIPLPEYSIIPRNAYVCRMEGNLHDAICSNELNFGLFASCLQRGDVKGIFCGHEHLNDFTGVYCGIRLSYCGGINYDCGCRDDIRGGRVVDIDEKDPWNFKTYMVKLQSLIGDEGNRRERSSFGLHEEDYFRQLRKQREAERTAK